MRLFGTLGCTFLYIVFTFDPTALYPILCAFVAATGFMGPIKAELLFRTTAKHIVPHLAFLAMGGVLLAAAL